MPVIRFRAKSYQSHRTYFHTALIKTGKSVEDTGPRVMDLTEQRSALTFELQARCSVGVVVDGKLL